MSDAVIYQFIHLLMTVFGIGGMIFMHFVLNPALATISPAEGGKLMGSIAKRFTIIAWSSTVLLLVTGLLKTPSGLLFDTSSAYGTVLLLKHLAFGIMIINGVIITFAVAPKLRAFAPKEGERPSGEFIGAQKRLGMLSGLNMALGVLVLLLISLV
jgi:uncharacterized membrane protein